MKNQIVNRDHDVKQKILQSKIWILSMCLLGLAGILSLGGQDQDISVEELLNNLKTERFTGKPIDIDVEDVGIKTLFSHLEKSSGLYLELSPDIPPELFTQKAYRFKQVPWDQILSLLLEEFSLEAIPKGEGVYIRPKKNNMMRIIREDQLQASGSSRIHPILYFLTLLVVAGGTGGFLFYKKRLKVRKSPSGTFAVNPDKADEIMKKVTYLFEVEKVFRKEEISLRSLSEELSIPSHQLSWVINKKMNITFSGLVNSYRVEEVKRRLASPEDTDNKTILDIAYDAGFNTKTSFNRVFKRLTRMTPSQYRQRYKVHF
jgi:AraC-like DNA-binding protein